MDNLKGLLGQHNSNNTRKNRNLQQGGVAPAGFQYPARMQQPSERVMEWATTAGAPMPPAAEMRNVAHGGKRRTHKHRRVIKRKSVHTKKASCGGRRRKTQHKRASHSKRRN
jgi:hypothetical protein